VPLTCAILVGLFLVQRRGTSGVATVFGPVTMVWFVSLAALGLPWIARHPAVLGAVNPLHAARFFAHHGRHGFLVLGSVFLCVTGGEALYADMGHFGRRAIRIAWYAVVLPALLVNYFGQGALLIERPDATNPFYALVPHTFLLPMVVLATMATIVASQALISGAFSLTRQAVAMGYWPRVTVVHTSGREEGQIYIPEINDLLMCACLALVLSFRSSDALASAYGIAVTGTMGITSLLFYFVCRDRWGWSRLRAAGALALFALFDLAFLGSNLAKLHQGGWVPLAVAAIVFCVMTTWKLGRAILAERLSGAVLPLSVFVADVELSKPIRVAGTAVFMSSNRRGTPHVLLHHLKHNKTLHRHVIVLSVVTDGVPETPAAERLRIKDFGQGLWAVTAHYGFMESPDVPALLGELRARGVRVDRDDVSYFLGRETLLCGGSGNLARWRKRLFAFLTRNARPATDFFGLPPNRVVEIGVQVEL
jgi:KUP system potassium uptake protein